VVSFGNSWSFTVIDYQWRANDKCSIGRQGLKPTGIAGSVEVSPCATSSVSGKSHGSRRTKVTIGSGVGSASLDLWPDRSASVRLFDQEVPKMADQGVST